MKSNQPLDKQITSAAQQFHDAKLAAIRPLAGGNINQTWQITPCSGADFILQRMNSQVFTDPEQSCRNMARLGQAFSQWQQGDERLPRWEIPCLLPTKDGIPWWYDEQGNLWRAMNFISATTTLSCLPTAAAAADLGRALALFHEVAATIGAEEIPATIAHFHDTPHYLGQLEHAAGQATAIINQEVEQLLEFIQPRRQPAAEIALARQRGELATTITHGDPKLANFLFDQTSLVPCSLIDLDTVGPGLRLYDLGDCLRSCAASHGEENNNGPDAHFDLDSCRRLLKGYCQRASPPLSPAESHYLPRAIWLLPFELGVRFLADFLSNNCYFRISYPSHNLQRAKLQFAYVASIENQQKQLYSLAP